MQRLSLARGRMAVWVYGGLSQCWAFQGCSHFCCSSEELCLGSSPASVPRASWKEPGNYSVPGFPPVSWPSHRTRKCVGLRWKDRSPALGNLLSECVVPKAVTFHCFPHPALPPQLFLEDHIPAVFSERVCKLPRFWLLKVLLLAKCADACF